MLWLITIAFNPTPTTPVALYGRYRGNTMNEKEKLPIIRFEVEIPKELNTPINTISFASSL